MKKAVYPGSFDPLTNGHLDIIERSLKIFDSLTIAIVENKNKKSLFTLEERKEIIKEATKKYKNVTVNIFSGLLIDYMKKKGANVIIRGLRAISDFEYEFQMALMNRQLCKDIETIFLMPSVEYTFLSSHLIKEITQLKGNVSKLVPQIVIKKLKEKIK